MGKLDDEESASADDARRITVHIEVDRGRLAPTENMVAATTSALRDALRNVTSCNVSMVTREGSSGYVDWWSRSDQTSLTPDAKAKPVVVLAVVMKEPTGSQCRVVRICDLVCNLMFMSGTDVVRALLQWELQPLRRMAFVVTKDVPSVYGAVQVLQHMPRMHTTASFHLIVAVKVVESTRNLVDEVSKLVAYDIMPSSSAIFVPHKDDVLSTAIIKGFVHNTTIDSFVMHVEDLLNPTFHVLPDDMWEPLVRRLAGMHYFNAELAGKGVTYGKFRDMFTGEPLTSNPPDYADLCFRQNDDRFGINEVKYSTTLVLDSQACKRITAARAASERATADAQVTVWHDMVKMARGSKSCALSILSDDCIGEIARRITRPNTNDSPLRFWSHDEMTKYAGGIGTLKPVKVSVAPASVPATPAPAPPAPAAPVPKKTRAPATKRKAPPTTATKRVRA